MEPELLFLQPVKKQILWGGNTLAAEYGFGEPGEAMAEAWAVSAHPAGDCRVAGGNWDGLLLSDLYARYPAWFGRKEESSSENSGFPLLVKFIDAKSDLSIQVHPDDAYAALHENGARGKSECWYILSAQPGAALVLGHNAQTFAQAKEWVQQGRWGQLLKSVPVHKGDFFRIDPGTVHAIGGGIRILETQQSSDITYRLYDYDRLQNGKPRPLHLKQSLEVMNVPSTLIREPRMPQPVQLLQGRVAFTRLEQCDYFSVFLLQAEGCANLPLPETFYALTVLEGEGCLNKVPVCKGQSVLVRHGLSEIQVQGCFTAMVSTPHHG